MEAFVIYTRDQCPVCDATIQKLNASGVEYRELRIGRDITRDEVLQKFPDAKVTPVIWHVGGEQVVSGDMFELMLIA